MKWELELSGAEVLAFALAVACAGLFVALFIMWVRPPRGMGGDDSATDLDGLRQSIGQLESELGRLIADMNGRIDAKMRVLRGLLDAADTAIRELRHLRASRSPSGDSVALGAANESPFKAANVVATPAVEHSTKPRDAARTNSPPTSEVVSSPEPLDNRTERYSHVYSLADAGLNSAQISAETGMHRGEVELVLNLRRKKVRLDRTGRPEPAHVRSHLEEATV